MATIPTVEILLATFNDARFIADFMDSIVSQTEISWRILVRDDGSVDATQEILVKWREQLLDRMIILPDSGKYNLGVAGNFSRLLQFSKAPYVMFANPDDVWHPHKIEMTLGAMRGTEGISGTNIPCLVHTDLRIVDADLRCIAPSLWRYQGLIPERNYAVSRVFVENTVWACTAMLNRALVQLTGEIPEESHHEDWWVAMVAAAFGVIVSLHQQPIDWRRHGNNDSKVSKLSDAIMNALASPRFIRNRLNCIIGANQPRVKIFLQRYRSLLSVKQVAAAEAFLALNKMGYFERRYAVMRHQLLFSSWGRNLGLLLFI